jgi:glycosyltransferase involved in cell wall biosynthesis
MAEKRRLTVFCNNYLGGVANFYRNILCNDKDNLLEKEIIFLDWEGDSEYARLPEKFGVGKEMVYEVKKANSLRQTANELSLLIGEDNGVIATNFGTELSSLHFSKKAGSVVVYICHDELYLANAIKYSFLIDQYITHNPHFFNVLKKQLPERVGDIHYIPYGIEVSDYSKQVNHTGILNIVWLARLHKLKGIYHLPEIDDLLKAENIHVNWTIIGDGPEKENFRELVGNRSNFSHHSPPDQKAVQEILKKQDVFILPSSLDGLPVAMLETMTMGIVPVMFEFNPGIRSVISEDIGFIVPVNDVTAMAKAIKELNGNRELLSKRSQLSRQKVETDYNIKTQAAKYLSLFLNSSQSDTKGKWVPIWKLNGREYHPLIPIFLVRLYRKIRYSS